MDKAGRVSDLNLVEEPLAAPGPGEARIKVCLVNLEWGGMFFSWLFRFNRSAAGKEELWTD